MNKRTICAAVCGILAGCAQLPESPVLVEIPPDLLSSDSIAVVSILDANGYEGARIWRNHANIEPASGAERVVGIHMNDMQPTRLTALPGSELHRLNELRWLLASNNSLTALPPAIGALPKLEVLDVARNSIGAIPPEIGNPPLVRLSLSLNQLGAIPSTIGECATLREFFVMGNQLSTLPQSFVGKALDSLDIGYNRICPYTSPADLVAWLDAAQPEWSVAQRCLPVDGAVVGTWQAVSAIDRITYTFSDSGTYDRGRFVFDGGITETTAGLFRTKSDTLPKWIDVVQTLSPTGTIDRLLKYGIFERRGVDTLAMALANVSDPRPDSFVPGVGKQVMLLVRQ